MIYYIYDSSSSIIGFKYNEDNYYYEKNLQEDIIGIINNNYDRVVTYEYNSWGQIVSVIDALGNIITDTNHIGIVNPFRYRSYYYDEETNLYYLNSRYYNPKNGRFISPDSVLGANSDLLSYNLYIYLSNNPINDFDPDGLGLFSKIKNLIKNWKSKTKKEKKHLLPRPLKVLKVTQQLKRQQVWEKKYMEML